MPKLSGAKRLKLVCLFDLGSEQTLLVFQPHWSPCCPLKNPNTPLPPGLVMGVHSAWNVHPPPPNLMPCFLASFRAHGVRENFRKQHCLNCKPSTPLPRSLLPIFVCMTFIYALTILLYIYLWVCLRLDSLC